MFMFQAKHRVEVVTKFISCFQVAPLVESATFVIYISNHDTPNTRYWTLHWFRAIPSWALGGERYPAPVGSHDKTSVQFLDRPRWWEAAGII